jgi:hypothetical protein
MGPVTPDGTGAIQVLPLRGMNLGIMDLRFMLKNPEYASPEGFNWNSPGFTRGTGTISETIDYYNNRLQFLQSIWIYQSV